MSRLWSLVGVGLVLNFLGCAEEEQSAAVPYSAFESVDPESLGGGQSGTTIGEENEGSESGTAGQEGGSELDPDTSSGEGSETEDAAIGDAGQEDVTLAECSTVEDCDEAGVCEQVACIDGSCVASAVDGGPCEDTDFCTENKTCVQGVCTGTPVDCDDGNDCTDDSCVNGCLNEPIETPECSLSVEILSPERGQIIYGAPVVAVTGTVTSPVSPLSGVALNGELIQVDQNGSFTTSVDSRIGLNLLRLEAETEAGTQASHSISYGYGDGLHTQGTPNDVYRLVSASGFWLNDTVFDDGNADLDDLSSLARLVLENLDVASVIPVPLLAEGDGPGVAWCDWEVEVATSGAKSLSYDLENVSVIPINGGIRLSASLANFEAWVEAVADGFGCPDGKGWLYADSVELLVEAKASIDVNGDIGIETNTVVVSVSEVEVDIIEGFSSLFNWLVDWFEDDLTKLIETELATFIPEEIVPVIEGALTEVTTVDSDFILPALPGGIDLPMTISARLAGGKFTPDGVEFALSGGIGIVSSIPVDSPGSIARGTCGGGGAGLNPEVGPLPEGTGTLSTVSEGDCCTPTPGVPGCGKPECEDCLCLFDGFCCATAWDALCVSEIDDAGCVDACQCGADSGEGCCGAQSGTGCATNVDCETCVCAVDPFCCNNGWDDTCGGTAKLSCPSQCGCNSGSSMLQVFAAGSCQGECGDKSGDCWCDALCVQNGDCCADACQYCGYCPPEEVEEIVGDTSEFVFEKTDPIEVRLHEDLLNHILHSAWQGGYLHVDLGPEVFEEVISDLGASDMSMTVYPLMPPIVTTCTDDGELEVHVGSVLCDATFNFNNVDASFKLYADIQTEISIQIVDDSGPQVELGVVLKELEGYQVDVLATEGLGTIGELLVDAVLTDALVQLLVADVLNNLIATYPVPTVDLNTLVSTIPPGTLMTGDFYKVGWQAGHFSAGGFIFKVDE